MNFYAKITPMRFGYRAEITETKIFDVPGVGTPVHFGFDCGTCWRFTKAGIERAAGRVVRRLEQKAGREGQAYRWKPAAR